MTKETEQSQAVYGSSDITDVLQVQESTLRKYCLLLEKNGYEFLKNEHSHRAFFDDDIIVLRKMISLKSNADMTLEEAVKSVIAWKNGNDIADSDTEEKRYVARYNDLLQEFKTFQEQQIELNKELIQEIRNQREYIDNRLGSREIVGLSSPYVRLWKFERKLRLRLKGRRKNGGVFGRGGVNILPLDRRNTCEVESSSCGGTGLSVADYP